MESIVILMCGALGGYSVPSFLRRFSLSVPVSVLLGVLGGMIGGFGYFFMFSPPPSFDGLMLLMVTSFIYGALLVVAASVVRKMIRAR